MLTAAPLTCAVLGYHRIPVVARAAELAPRAGCMVHAPRAGACQGVTAAEQHVGIRVPTAVAGLARAADHQGIAIVPWGTPGEIGQVKAQQGVAGGSPQLVLESCAITAVQASKLVTAAALRDHKALCVLPRGTPERCLYHRLQVKAKHS